MQKKQNKPLLLGVRQVGKTYSVQKFAKENYEQVFYINFEASSSYLELFDLDLDPNRIIKAIELGFNRMFNPLTDIIVFDEVQLSHKCITSLKYFNEDRPDCHIICAGSLLGVMLKRERFSFPVGKVEFAYMYPLNFSEFLVALDRRRWLEEIEYRKKRC